MMRALEDLKAEHGLIKRVLHVVEAEVEAIDAGGAPRVELLRDVLSFGRGFAEACHHAKEEEVLFPALAASSDAIRKGPIRILTSEHEAARHLMGELEGALNMLQRGDGATAISAARRSLFLYARLLRNHITKEEEIIFRLAEALLPAAEQARLAARFEEVERARGEGAHERFHELVERLEAVLPTPRAG